MLFVTLFICSSETALLILTNEVSYDAVDVPRMTSHFIQYGENKTVSSSKASLNKNHGFGLRLHLLIQTSICRETNVGVAPLSLICAS